jgi:hypothetical protein
VNGFPEKGEAWERSMLETIRAWCASHPLVVGYALTALVTITLRIAGSAWWEAVKASHPRVAALANLARALGFDAPKLVAAVRVLLGLPPALPPGDDTPKPPSVAVRAAGTLLLALSVTAIGCAGALPVVAQIVVDAGCVASHYDELAAAEQAGRGPFLLAIERTARACGIEQQLVVTLFGSAKAQRIAAPACSASSLASPVKP